MKSDQSKEPAEKIFKAIRRATRKQYSAEEKIRIVLAGLRGEDSIAALCRRESINQNLYYRWSKEFLEAGKKRLCLPFIPSAPATEANCNNRPCAYGRLLPTTTGRESKDFCGGQS